MNFEPSGTGKARQLPSSMASQPKTLRLNKTIKAKPFCEKLKIAIVPDSKVEIDRKQELVQHIQSGRYRGSMKAHDVTVLTEKRKSMLEVNFRKYGGKVLDLKSQ